MVGVRSEVRLEGGLGKLWASGREPSQRTVRAGIVTLGETDCRGRVVFDDGIM